MANQRRRTLTTAAIGLMLVALAPRIASAQSTDRRLLPWFGCWEPANGAESGDLLCVRPASQSSAAEVVRLAGNEIVSREVVWADGARHETERGDCSGWEEGTFSKDGRRLFLTSEHTCDSGTEDGAGIMAIASPTEWLDIRTAGTGDDVMAWVQRYQLAGVEKTKAAGFEDVLDAVRSSRTARMVAAAPLDVDDVIEATGHAPHQAVEALLAERGDQLALSSGELVRLSDAGVPASTIDVAVAVSYPEVFHVAQGEQPERAAPDEGDLDRRWGQRGMWGTTIRTSTIPSTAMAYGYGYGLGGYYGGGYGGGYYGGYGYVPTVIVVDRQSSDAQHGRFVAGRGYTRGGSGSSTGGAARSYPAGSSSAVGAVAPRAAPVRLPGPAARPPRGVPPSRAAAAGADPHGREADPIGAVGTGPGHMAGALSHAHG